VLVTSVLVSIFAAGILRMAMLRYKANSRNEYVMKEKRLDQSALNTIVTSWAAAGSGATGYGVSCANNVPNYSCSPASVAPPGTCGCTCTPTTVTNPPQPTVTTAGTPANCTLTIGTGNDLMPAEN